MKMKSLLYINPQSYTYKELLQSAKKRTALGTNLLLHGFLSFCPDLGSAAAPASVSVPREELTAAPHPTVLSGHAFSTATCCSTNPTLRSLQH